MCDQSPRASDQQRSGYRTTGRVRRNITVRSAGVRLITPFATSRGREKSRERLRMVVEESREKRSTETATKLVVHQCSTPSCTYVAAAPRRHYRLRLICNTRVSVGVYRIYFALYIRVAGDEGFSSVLITAAIQATKRINLRARRSNADEK